MLQVDFIPKLGYLHGSNWLEHWLRAKGRSIGSALQSGTFCDFLSRQKPRWGTPSWRQASRGQTMEVPRAREYSRSSTTMMAMPTAPFTRSGFPEVIYVLHAFQKKSSKGIKTARRNVDLVAARLKVAQEDHEERCGKAKQ